MLHRMKTTTLTHIKSSLFALLTSLSLVFSASLEAGTIVRIQTQFGNMDFELYDDSVPNTVANFLSYVRNESYDSTFFHELNPSVGIKGGLFRFPGPSLEIFITDVGPAITPDNAGISNTFGTIAMVPVPSDNSTVDAEWAINLNNNSFLDAQGYVVFGEILDPSNPVLTELAFLQVAAVGALGPDVPVTDDYSVSSGIPPQPDNMIVTFVDVIAENQPNPVNSLNVANNRLSLQIDAGDLGLLALDFSIVPSATEVVIQAEAASLEVLSEAVEGMSTLDLSSNRLTIPNLSIDGAAPFAELVFVLSDDQQLQFTLESFSES